MIISAKIIYKPRKHRQCPQCFRAIEGPTLRLYGCAHEGDPKYCIYLHPACDLSRDLKIVQAIDKMRKECIDT
jgi:hypothetical protein